MPKDPKKILVIRLDHAGDMLMTTPVFKALKQLFPQAEVNVLCRPFVKELIETNKNVDKIYTFEPPWFDREKNSGWLSTICFLRQVRKQNFDLVIELHADPRNIFAAFLIGGYRIGYGIRGGGFLLNKVVSYEARTMHVIERNLAVLAPLDGDGKKEIDLTLTKEDVVAVKKLAGKQIKKYVLCYIGAGRPEKYWVNQSWIELCNKLLEKNVVLILAGYTTDVKNAEEILQKIPSKMKSKIINLCGKIKSLRHLGALVVQSKLVISTDTVTVHLAHALKIPLIGLYGPTDHEVWGYTDERSIAVYKKLRDVCGNDCRKEMHRLQMMKEITVDDVLEAVEKLLR